LGLVEDMGDMTGEKSESVSGQQKASNDMIH
jgi:hypothetical protein